MKATVLRFHTLLSIMGARSISIRAHIIKQKTSAKSPISRPINKIGSGTSVTFAVCLVLPLDRVLGEETKVDLV